MTQIFNEQGDVIPVTLIKAGPCKITQIKNDKSDGYTAVQIGFDKKKNLSGTVKGHLKGLDNFKWLREFRIDAVDKLKKGDEINIANFEVGNKVKITGISKGKGFQGVVKRHGFHGQDATHGNKDQERMPGSIGATEPARVFKGMKMPGHMGAERISVKNLEIVKIDLEKNIIYIKGAIPGTRNSLVEIVADGELKVNVKKGESKDKKIEEKVVEEKIEKSKEEVKEKPDEEKIKKPKVEKKEKEDIKEDKKEEK